MSNFTHDLEQAACDGNREEVSRIVAQGGNVNARGNDGRTALHWAVRAGHSDLVADLLEYGADPNVIDDYGYSPLALGIAEQDETCEKACVALRKMGAQYGITEAAAMGDLLRVEEVLRIDPTAASKAQNAKTLLSLLVCVGSYGELTDRYAILRLLISHGLVASGRDAEQLANSAEASNLGEFARLLRQWQQTQVG